MSRCRILRHILLIACLLGVLCFRSGGPAYVFYSSADGKTWQVLRVFSLGDGLKTKVGFESQSPAGSGTEVVFSEIG